MSTIDLADSYRFIRLKYLKPQFNDNSSGSPVNYLAYMIKGKCKITSPEITIEVSEGDMFFIPISLKYESFWYGEEIECISLGFTFMPDAKDKHFILQKILCEDLLCERMKNFPVGMPLTAKILAEFYSILSKTITSMQTEEHNNDIKLCNKITKVMSMNLTKTISEIAYICNISESTLYSIFKSTLNKTPNTVKQELIIRKAISLLTTTDKSIQEISDSLYFSSTSYFRKVFKQFTGKTPKEIRKSSPKT